MCEWSSCASARDGARLESTSTPSIESLNCAANRPIFINPPETERLRWQECRPPSPDSVGFAETFREGAEDWDAARGVGRRASGSMSRSFLRGAGFLFCPARPLRIADRLSCRGGHLSPSARRARAARLVASLTQEKFPRQLVSVDGVAKMGKRQRQESSARRAAHRNLDSAPRLARSRMCVGCFAMPQVYPQRRGRRRAVYRPTVQRTPTRRVRPSCGIESCRCASEAGSAYWRLNRLRTVPTSSSP